MSRPSARAPEAIPAPGVVRRWSRPLDGLRRRLAVMPPGPGSEPRSDVTDRFRAACRELTAPSVLELGTLRSQPDRSTMHRDWVPHAREFLGTDITAGPDVDLVADAHALSQVTGAERFDAIISCSTFEHFKYPHLAAHEVMRALTVGGLLFVQTHQSFPLHGYPSDYFRFSREALASLFPAAMGFEVIAAGYDFPARIYSHEDRFSHLHPAFLNTALYGRKVAPTPDEHRYEL